jgi:hypothetical protein
MHLSSLKHVPGQRSVALKDAAERAFGAANLA